jgi:hypothetical protein
MKTEMKIMPYADVVEFINTQPNQIVHSRHLRQWMMDNYNMKQSGFQYAMAKLVAMKIVKKVKMGHYKVIAE